MGFCGGSGIPIFTNDILYRILNEMRICIDKGAISKYAVLREQYRKKYEKDPGVRSSFFTKAPNVYDKIVELVFVDEIIPADDYWKVLERELYGNKKYKSIKRIRAEHWLNKKYLQAISLIGLGS